MLCTKPLKKLILAAGTLSCATVCSAIAPDFQQALIPSQVLILSDNYRGSGTIVHYETDDRDKSRYIWVLTADHVVRKGGTEGTIRTNLRAVTNSLAGSATIPFLKVPVVYSGGGVNNRIADMALAFLKIPDTYKDIDFSKAVAKIAPFNTVPTEQRHYLTTWGYGDSGSPITQGGNWIGYDNSIEASNTLRFENNVFDKMVNSVSDGDNYDYKAIQATLDRYDKDRVAWVRGEGASYEGDSGGAYMAASEQSATFTLKSDNNPQGRYNGPDSDIKDGKVTIPYRSDVIVAIHTLGFNVKGDRTFGKALIKGAPILAGDIDWMEKKCGCKFDRAMAPYDKPLPLTAAKSPVAGASGILFVLCGASLIGLLIPFRTSR